MSTKRIVALAAAGLCLWGALIGLIVFAFVAVPISTAVAFATHPASQKLFGGRLEEASLAGYTLPATLDPGHVRGGTRTSSDTQTLTVAPASIVKSVDKASAPIGDTVSYSLLVTLPKNVQFYDTTITDTLPTGVSFGLCRLKPRS